MASMVVVIPILGYAAVPVHVKAAFSFALTIIVFPLVSLELAPLSNSPIELIIVFAREVLVGLIIGFITTIVFFGIQMAGQIVGIQIGFGIINIIDPYTNIQISLIGQLNYLVALLVFICLEGHHFLIRALVLCYEYIPLAGASFPTGLPAQVNLLSGLVFDVALRVAAPIMVALLITDVALGLIARVAPQMNVFLVGFPLKIGVGLFVLTMTVSYFPYIFGKLFDQFQRDVLLIIRLLGS